MNIWEDERVRRALAADVEALVRLASLPTSQATLWRAKRRAARNQRRRVGTFIALVEGASAGILALTLIALIWADLRVSPVQSHLTTVVLGLVTVLAVAILVSVPRYVRFPGR
jgi:hypothetical protein